MSPTARSLKFLRDLGYIAQVVEHYNPFSKRKKDLFGVGDILGVHTERGILLVQATSDSNSAARVKKCLAEPQLAIWLHAGGRFEVWSWGLRGKRGLRKRWSIRRRKLILSTSGTVVEDTDAVQ